MKSHKKKYNFGESISPQSIQPIIKKPSLISDLIKWQSDELSKFKKLITNDNIKLFIKHYRNNIKKNLVKEKLFEDYFEHIKFYSRMEETKIISLLERIDKAHSQIMKREDELQKKRELIQTIRKSWNRKSKSKLSKLQRKNMHDFLVESFKATCKHISIYNSFIYSSFFIIEYNCKFLCALGCFRFAKNISESKTIGHSDIWKTLKNLVGKQKSSICNHCFARKSCDFRIFSHLSNIYASSIKLRMLCDYSEVFTYLDNEEVYDIISNKIIPSIKGVHKFTNEIITKSKIMFSPISEEELGLV